MHVMQRRAATTTLCRLERIVVMVDGGGVVEMHFMILHLLDFVVENVISAVLVILVGNWKF
jgi:hypothetical protein